MKKPTVQNAENPSNDPKRTALDSGVAAEEATGTPEKYSPVISGQCHVGLGNSTSTRTTGGPWAGKLSDQRVRGRIVAIYNERGEELDPDSYLVSEDGKSVTLFKSHTATLKMEFTRGTADSFWTNISSYTAEKYQPGNRQDRRTQQSLARRGKRVKPKAPYERPGRKSRW